MTSYLKASDNSVLHLNKKALKTNGHEQTNLFTSFIHLFQLEVYIFCILSDERETVS